MFAHQQSKAGACCTHPPVSVGVGAREQGMENNDRLIQVPDEHSLKGRTESVHLRSAWEWLSVNFDMALSFLNDKKRKIRT